MYMYLDGVKPRREPESTYVSINHNGEVWHLFNAARMPLGRMAQRIAELIRGKHKPNFVLNRDDLGDKVVVVNASKVMVTGKKMRQKIYRHYTGYVGGLKEIYMRDLVQKDPSQVIRRAVKGMMPKNNIRLDIIDKHLYIHAGPYHNHFAQKLP